MMQPTHDFTRGPIFSKLISFMLPILLSLVLQSLYGAVDMLIVGRFGTTAGISGVAVGGNVMNLFTMLLNAITMGVTVLMGQYIGSRRFEQVNRLIGNAVAFFLALSLLLTVGIVIFARPLALAMQTPDEAVDLTVQYIRICGAGFIFITFYNFISAMLRGVGDSNTPLVFVAIASVVNIIGDLVLVAGLKMNVAGAAIATVVAQAVSVVLSLWIIRHKKMAFSFQRKYFNFGSEVPRFVRLGLPLTVQGFLTNFSFLAVRVRESAWLGRFERLRRGAENPNVRHAPSRRAHAEYGSVCVAECGRTERKTRPKRNALRSGTGSWHRLCDYARCLLFWRRACPPFYRRRSGRCPCL